MELDHNQNNRQMKDLNDLYLSLLVRMDRLEAQEDVGVDKKPKSFAKADPDFTETSREKSNRYTDRFIK